MSDQKIMPTGLPAKDRSGEFWPQWHVSVLADEEGLPYDANGCIYWKGKYHLMYIFQDPRLPMGGHCWGHASSSDLVNWTFHPAALAPAKGDPDVGIFSGNAFVGKDGRPMLCWFGVNAGVCVATADDDDLLHWTKHPHNPILPCPKEGQSGHGVYTVWDPYLWLEGDTYYCLLGGNRLPNGKDTLYLCRSADLVNWQPVGPFYEHPDLSWTTDGEDCSCPDFFPLGDRHALMCISHKVGCRLYVGRFDKQAERFLPERHIRMNWPGGKFFAADSLLDGKGRRVYWAWVTDPRMVPTRTATGSGVQSLPRVVSLESPPGGGEARVTFAPAPELEALRRNPRMLPEMELPAGKDVTLEGVAGESLELELEIAPQGSQRVGLLVYASPDGREETAIWYDPCAGMLSIDASRSSLRTDLAYCWGPLNAYGIKTGHENKTPCPVTQAPLRLASTETLRLRVFLDGPIVEVFANDIQCLTQQVFPSLASSRLVKLHSQDSPVRLVRARAWDMAAAEFIDRR